MQRRLGDRGLGVMKMINGQKCNKEKMVFLVARTNINEQMHYTIRNLIEVKERG